MRRLWLIISGSVVGLVAILLVTVLTVGGLFATPHYLEPWAADYAAQRDDPRVQLAAYGLLAPNSHNMQPWIIELDSTDADVFSLYVDAERLTPAVDPVSRQIVVSQGTFLQYLTVGAAHLGIGVAIELFPEGEYDEANLAVSMTERPVARLVLNSDEPGTGDALAADFDSLFLSDTNRSPYSDETLSADQVSAFSDTAGASVARLDLFTEAADVATLGAFGVQGTTIESGNADVASESAGLFRTNENEKNDSRYGFAVEGQGTSGFMKYLLQGLLTLLPSMNTADSAATRDVAMATAAAAATPAYALISTPGNSRTEQVEAGLLYGAVSLRARTLGLVVQPISQVLEEYESMAEPYAAIHSEYAPAGATLQMLVRVGTATTEYPVTMRRDVESLLR
ncbi:hypothetical protein D6T64_11420 [Cryobacterium melibiosiphilum]|uniref:Nitroreductase domain-containing protein n=2 Tax=Cryobacterium melibiosiphilum TaxID=995039 RepID=A0A3A5MQA1_9MICO|nr:hypothetical protein D6T64_11420 [Cryobacterium melibiosiphilum]